MKRDDWVGVRIEGEAEMKRKWRAKRENEGSCL